jgi:hypothetical protein
MSRKVYKPGGWKKPTWTLKEGLWRFFMGLKVCEIVDGTVTGQEFNNSRMLLGI